MTSKTLPDGTLVELVRSGKVYGPDSHCPLNYGTTYNYVRINGGEWQTGPRQAHRLIDWLDSCHTRNDLEYVLEELR